MQKLAFQSSHNIQLLAKKTHASFVLEHFVHCNLSCILPKTKSRTSANYSVSVIIYSLPSFLKKKTKQNIKQPLLKKQLIHSLCTGYCLFHNFRQCLQNTVILHYQNENMLTISNWSEIVFLWNVFKNPGCQNFFQECDFKEDRL